MDASTRLNLLLNGVKIPKEELSPTDWYDLVMALIADCNPRFKYLTGLKRIREHGEDWKFEVGDGSKIPIEEMGTEFLPADRFLYTTELSRRDHPSDLNAVPQHCLVSREHLLLAKWRVWVRAVVRYELTGHSASNWRVWLYRFEKEDVQAWFGKTIEVTPTPDHNTDKEICGLVVCERLVEIIRQTIVDKRFALTGLETSFENMSARIARIAT